MAINPLYKKHWERLGKGSGREEPDAGVHEHKFIKPAVLNQLYVCVCFKTTLLGSEKTRRQREKGGESSDTIFVQGCARTACCVVL